MQSNPFETEIQKEIDAIVGPTVSSCEYANCNDGNPCTDDSCNPATGKCVYVNNAAPCDDDNACTTGDTCSAGLCQGGAQIICDDGKACTDDSCNPASGCVNLDNAAPCDDGNACTTGDTCSEGSCKGAAVSCDDGKACTDDSCDPASGCVNLDNAAPCDDGNTCTTGDTCSDGSCKGAAISCDDGDACTTDTCDTVAGCIHTALDCNNNDACTKDSCDPATGCTTEPVVCDDGNESTSDSCQAGECIYRPIGSYENNSEISVGILVADNLSRFSLNNSTALFAANSAEHRTECRKDGDCDDGNHSTNDYCYRGNCTHTTSDCVSDDCHIGTFNGTSCIKIPKCRDRNPCTDDICDRHGVCHYKDRCDDGNPCTIDRCDRYGHCTHSQVVCGYGQTCIDGVCRYPYYYYYPDYNFYPYYPYDVPYVPPTPVAAAPTAPKPQSYTIPAGTSITLPWGGSMLAAEALQVYNGLAYPGAKPISFERELGSPAQVASVGRMALSAMNQWEMIGLAWKEAGFQMTLIQPNKTALPAQGDGQNVVHLTGSTYDYYFLRSPTAGIWTVQIMPVNAASSGTGYSLISGLVQGPIPPPKQT